MTIWRLLLITTTVLLVNSPLAMAQTEDVPVIKSRINDHALAISDSQKHLLYQMLAQFDKASRYSVVVVTAPSTGGDTTPDYAGRIWKAWVSEKKAKTAMLLLLKEQGKAAILGGSELHELLSEEAVAGILERSVEPTLSKGDFDGAAMEGVKEIISVIKY